MRTLIKSLIVISFLLNAHTSAFAEAVRPTPIHTVSSIVLPDIPGWKSINVEGSLENVFLVQEKTGAVIRARIVSLNGSTLKQIAFHEVVVLQSLGHDIVTSTCCAPNGDARVAWSAYVPQGLDSKGRTRVRKKNSPITKRGAVVVRAIRGCEDRAVVIVATWNDRDHKSMERDVRLAIDGLELR